MWFRVDDKLWGSPKWLALKPGARALWVTAGAWSMDQLTDGFVPTHVVRVLGSRPRDAEELVSCGMWENSDGGFTFHDWHDWQPTRESVINKREQEAARKAEWRAKRAAKRAGEGQSPAGVPDMSLWDNDVSPAGVPDMSRSSRPDPTRPDPTAPKGATSSAARWSESADAIRNADANADRIPDRNADPNAEREREKEREKDTPPPSPDTRDFDDFWAAYPRKVDKGKARKAWSGALRKTDAQTIIKAARAYAQSDDAKREGGKYLKYPATWLNAEAWENGTVVPLRPAAGGLTNRQRNPWMYQ